MGSIPFPEPQRIAPDGTHLFSAIKVGILEAGVMIPQSNAGQFGRSFANVDDLGTILSQNGGVSGVVHVGVGIYDVTLTPPINPDQFPAFARAMSGTTNTASWYSVTCSFVSNTVVRVATWENLAGAIIPADHPFWVSVDIVPEAM